LYLLTAFLSFYMYTLMDTIIIALFHRFFDFIYIDNNMIALFDRFFAFLGHETLYVV